MASGGNIGLPALMLLDAERELYVLELSSFQLKPPQPAGGRGDDPNVTEDHMDRYPLELQQYRAAKLRVWRERPACIVNADDALTMPVRGADDRCISLALTLVTIT